MCARDVWNSQHLPVLRQRCPAVGLEGYTLSLGLCRYGASLLTFLRSRSCSAQKSSFMGGSNVLQVRKQHFMGPRAPRCRQLELRAP